MDGFCHLKMMKSRGRQATHPQKLKNCQRLFLRFLLVEAVDEIAASTSLTTTIDHYLNTFITEVFAKAGFAVRSIECLTQIKSLDFIIRFYLGETPG